MKNVIIDVVNLEFSYALFGIWVSYYLTQKNIQTTLITNIDLPNQLKDIISQRYILHYSTELNPKSNRRNNQREQGHRVNLLRKLFYSFYKDNDVFSPIPTTIFKSDSFNKYVCISPFVIKEKRKTKKINFLFGMSFEQLSDIAKYIKNKGYHVYSFSDLSRCHKKELDSVSDKVFLLNDKENVKKNTFLQRQLFYYKNSKTTITTAGASSVPVFFDVPGIGWDINFYNTLHGVYKHIFKDLITNRNSHFITADIKKTMVEQKIDFYNRKVVFSFFNNLVMKSLEKLL